MPKLCDNPECRSEVNERVYHVRWQDRLFCSDCCASSWVVQNKAFEVAAHPFHEPMRPSRYRG